MFGRIIDYYLLLPFTHSKNIATEDELNYIYSKHIKPIDIAKAEAKLHKLLKRMGGKFPLNSSLSYLDIGCGDGDLAIPLCKHGIKNLTGIDIIERNITAAVHNARVCGIENSAKFVCEDISKWSPKEKFDVVISHEALEHIDNPEQFLKQMTGLIKPEGYAILAFGPLFHSPFGDHMHSFFKIQIPWRGALFSEKALLRLRQEKFRPTDPAKSYSKIKGGLNLLRFSEFLKYADKAGWRIDYISVNPQLKKIPGLYELSNLIMQIPFFRDYFASSVYAILRLK